MQLTDAQIERNAPYLPRPGGHSKVGQRQVLSALLYMAIEGYSWRALPEGFGSWHTICVHLNGWAKQVVLERVLSILHREQMDALDSPTLSLDNTTIQLHPNASGVLRRGSTRRSAARRVAGRPNCTPSSPTSAPRCASRCHPDRMVTSPGDARSCVVWAPASAGAGHGPRL